MAYIGTSPANGVRRKHTYTATAGQTSFSGADDNNVTLTYVDTEYLDVYQNGVKLVAVSDYASTTGTSVVLVQGASVDDTVEIIVFDVFSVADTVSAGSGGSFGGNIGIGGTLAVTGALTVNDPIQILNGSNVRAASSDADDLIVEGPADCGISILSATTGRIYFGDAANDDAGSIRYVHSDDSMRFETNDVEAMRIRSDGAITKPLQPAFMARPSSRQSNLAINTTHTIAFGAEVFDQNADFSSNTFTAPITGKYQLNVHLLIQQMDAATDYYYINLKTSNRNYDQYWDNNDKAGDNSNGEGRSVVVLADMDAGDTAYLQIGVPNSGAAQMDVETASAFSGYLVC